MANAKKGLIRLHILHHASEAEFYGQWMIHELARHGYTLSPGTLYPMLHGLERRGYLQSKTEQNGRTFRRLYRATALGREANRLAKIQVRELIGELQRWTCRASEWRAMLVLVESECDAVAVG